MENYSPFWTSLHTSHESSLCRIAFTDGLDVRILTAVRYLIDNQLLLPMVLGSQSTIKTICEREHIAPLPDSVFSPPIPDSVVNLIRKTFQKDDQNTFKNPPLSDEKCTDSLICGVALLAAGVVDGLVAGSTRPTADVIKTALALVGCRKGVRFVSGQFLIESTFCRTIDGGPFLFADCAVMPDPSPHALAMIAKEAAEAYQFFIQKPPHVAFLSFSTRGSADHSSVARVREAVAYLRKDSPQIAVDGEMQADAALDPQVAILKHMYPSPVAGRANILIFPTLEAGNIAYKLIQRFSKVRIAGPILWGLNKPMSDLSRGCTGDEVIDTALCVARMAKRMS